MTEKQAKEESLLVWRYLRDHPEIYDKSLLPEKIYSVIRGYWNTCPLCQLYVEELGTGCEECPLYKAGEDCYSALSAFYKWWDNGTKEDREHNASRIVDIIEAWEVE